MKKIIALLLVVLTVLLCGCSMGDGSIRFGAAGLGGLSPGGNFIKTACRK